MHAPDSRRAPRARGTGTLTVEVCSDERAFADLGPAWRRLQDAGRRATPFQSHAWLHSWWLSYGRPGRLRLFLVRRGGDLLAAAPMMRTTAPLPALVPLGGGITDFNDVLLHEEAVEEAATALARALGDAARTALVDFGEVRPGSAVEEVYRRWRGPRRRLPDSACLELPPAPMGDLMARLPANRAQRVRNKLNKIGKLGISWQAVAPEETADSLRRMLELHRLQWEGRGVSPEHVRPRFAEHLVRSVVPMARTGEALVREYRLEGETVAVDLTLLSPRLAGVYLYGVHPRLRERKADVATMVLQAAAEQAAGGHSAALSLLRGDEPYKYRWRPETVVNERLLLARRRTAPLLAAALAEAAARSRAKALLRRRAQARAPQANENHRRADAG
ncbi:GNAT family N-acetyltransferase [Streptomyces polyrhachis]|uniref:GNAT family N-acetyltransferase n=1 Tax=Streptomyces polyrhachis TaxID=1282885 RepID=A0ABW2GJW6_9ACTN